MGLGFQLNSFRCSRLFFLIIYLGGGGRVKDVKNIGFYLPIIYVLH